MPVLTYQGTIGVPIFDTGVDMTPVNGGLWSNLTFDRFSLCPLVGADLFDTAGVAGSGTSGGGVVMPAVEGQGYVHLFNTNTPPSGSNARHPSWYDNNLFWANGNTTSVTNGTFYNQRLPQVFVPGNYELPSYMFSNPITYFNVPNQLGHGPGQIGNTKIQTILYNESDLITRFALNDWQNNATYLGDSTFEIPNPYGRINTDVEYIPNRGTEVGSNVLFIAGGVYYQNKITYFTPTRFTMSQDNQIVNIDDVGLDAIWQASSYGTVAVYYKGFIITVPTPGGSGPSNQNNEYLVTDPEMTQYYLLKFLPQDEYSSQVLATNAVWNVNIDVNGIIWLAPNSFASGQQGKVLFSYSRSGFSVPTINNPQFPPFVLPCWNNCQPSVIMT